MLSEVSQKKNEYHMIIAHIISPVCTIQKIDTSELSYKTNRIIVVENTFKVTSGGRGDPWEDWECNTLSVSDRELLRTHRVTHRALLYSDDLHRR